MGGRLAGSGAEVPSGCATAGASGGSTPGARTQQGQRLTPAQRHEVDELLAALEGGGQLREDAFETDVEAMPLGAGAGEEREREEEDDHERTLCAPFSPSPCLHFCDDVPLDWCAAE